MRDIQVGQIWEVTTEYFLTSTKSRGTPRPVKILKGEKIEIRYPFAWHFRTEDNIYFHAEESMILHNCKLIGKIWPEVKTNNVAKLEEIIRLRLYDKITYKCQ